MMCTIVYYEDGKKAPTVLGCENYAAAVAMINKKLGTYGAITNAQILVDYANVEMYKRKFEELYEIMKNNFLNVAQNNTMLNTDTINKDKVTI